MTKLLAALVAVFLCLPAYAQPNPRTGAATVLPWVAVDGDTVKRGKLRVRAFDYDTPEIRGKCQAEKDMALKAKAILAELMAPPHRFTVRYHKGHDEFGRAVGDFYSDGRRIDIDNFPVGYSRRYNKAIGRQGWC
jgi:micrococcal nuclease